MHFVIHTVDETTSTNDDVRRHALEGAQEGLVVLAKRQACGRGRMGRVWESPAGNLYFSFLVRPSVPLRRWGWHSFIAGLAVAQTIKSILPDVLVELKWPNDVLVGGKKISGILLEAGDGFLVVGIGLNVEHAPQNAIYPVTSLAESAQGRPITSAKEILDSILGAFAVWSETMTAQGFEPVRQAWLAFARKGRVRVRFPDGEVILGEFLDLDAQGCLCLGLADGSEKRIPAGDVL